MEKDKMYKFLAFWSTMILVLSVITVAAGAFVPDDELDSEIGDVVLVERTGTEEISMLNDMDVEIVDRYGMYTLIDIGEESIETLERSGLEVNTLPHQSEINVKGNTIDVTEEDGGLPIESAVEEDTIGSDLEIDGYESGEEGIYLINTLGPINPEWVDTLEDEGVEIINYVPNYAYEVEMTPEQAEDVEDLFFVDWVGIYQPSYKLYPRLDEALDRDIPVTVNLRPGYDSTTLRLLESQLNVLSAESHPENGAILTVDVNSEEMLEDLAMKNDVYHISPFVEPELHAEMETQMAGGGLWFMDDEYETNTTLDPEPREGDPQEPYRKHGDYGAYINQIGYKGEGVTITTADTGIGDGTVGDAGHEDFTGRVIDGYGFGPDEDYWGDGFYHGTACTGLIAGDTHHGTGETMNLGGEEDYYMGQGLAPEAEIFATKIFDDDGGFMPAEYYPIVEEPAQRSDAYIHSNSWGAPTWGEYTLSDEIFDQAVRDADRETDENRQMIITTSVGNDGPGARGGRGGYQSTGSPSNAKNVISVGGNQPYNPPAYENPELMYDTSSRGWTEDNRVKPDLIAPSESIISQNSPLTDGGYVQASGTSFGNPIVAGAATVVVEWYEEHYGEKPSPAMVRSILINTANGLDPDAGGPDHIENTEGPVPNRDEGWGVPDISKLEYPKEDPVNFMFDDQETILETGDEEEYSLYYDQEDRPLKITLSWTDAHAEAGDATGGVPTLKNNLNLEVETPAGETIRGNAFDLSGDGESDDGFTYPEAEVMEPFDYYDDGWDDVNNVQNVFIPEEDLIEGMYTVRVIGRNIPEDAIDVEEEDWGQDFALTAYNAHDQLPKDGELNLDRDEYSGDDTVKIDLLDYDLQGEGTYDLNVTSVDADGNEIDEEWVTLYEHDTMDGYFEGMIETTEDPEEEDALYVEHDGEITAWYLDEDPGAPTEDDSQESMESEEDETLTSTSGEINNDGYISHDGVEHISADYEEGTSEYEEAEIKDVDVDESSKPSTLTPRPEGDYEVREPIVINNNTDFHNQADEEGWPGDGSEDDPYIIEGYEIDAGQYDPDYAVYMEDVNLSFEVRDSYLYNASAYAIRIDYVENGEFINLTVADSGRGIGLVYSDNNVVTENKIMNSDMATSSWYTEEGNEFTHNYADGDNRYGYFAGYSQNDYIAYNDFGNLEVDSIMFQELQGGVVEGNHLYNASRSGIYSFLDSIDNTIKDNVIENNPTGVRVSGVDEPEFTVKYNDFIDNDVGVDTDGPGNLFYGNRFIGNDLHADEAYDNEWDAGDPAEDGDGGNYWEDYEEVTGGEDRGDGIGDEPYPIPPTGIVEDNYPWVYEVPGQFEHDVGVLDIFPSGVAPNETMEVEAFVANLGQYDEEDVPVSYEIGRMDTGETWSNTTYVDLDAEEFKWVNLGEWTPPEEVEYYNNISTDLEGDQNPDNAYLNETFEIRDIHDVGFTDIIHPGEKQPYVEEIDSSWEWLYYAQQRADTDGSTARTEDSTYHAGMKLEVEDRQGEYFTDVAYYDYEDGGEWAEATIATVEYVDGQPVVDEFVGSSEKYETDGLGWVELELEEPVEIEEEEYFVLMHVHDYGSFSFPMGRIEYPVDRDGGWWTVADGDPTDPDDWDNLADSPFFPGLWQVEAQITDYTWPQKYEDTVFNETQPVEGLVENFGNKHETDVPVEAEITCDETGDIEYYDESTIASIERGETVIATFEDWDPSSTGYYNVNMTTDLENDENPENDHYEKTIHVEAIDIDFEATSIDKPEEPMYQYDEKEVKGTVTNVGNYRTSTPAQMTIERVNENILVDEDFSDGLPADWSVVDKDGSGYAWEFDEDDEAMKVSSEVDSQNDVLWTETVDATDATHRFMVEFYSEFEGDISRDLLISTDGGETSQRVKTNIPEGEVSYDLVDWAGGEDEVMIGWEFFTEDAEEDEYWLIDDVKMTSEYLEEPEYEDDVTSEELYPGRSTQVEFANWMPDEDDLPSDYIFTFETTHEEDDNLENTVTKERMFVDYNLPPEAPTDPSPEDGEDDVSHIPEFSTYVSDPNERDMDVTFYLLNETGEEEIANETVSGVQSGTRASFKFPMYLEPESTYQWYVEVTDGDEATTSDTWTFHTYEPEPVWKTACARINAEPPEPVENLHVDWDDEIWEVEANELTWDASPDDGAGENDTNHYVIYRADSEYGPWNESTRIDTVNADGSEAYTYMDEGMANDGVRWHYVVRAVDRQDNMEMNEDYVAEKPLPEATDPIPEDGAEVEELNQTVSSQVTSPTGEPLEVEFYHGDTHEVIGEMSGIVDQRLVTYYTELTEEDMGQDHYWYVYATYEDYNVGNLAPDEVTPERVEEEWHWLYDEEHRYPSDNAVGLTSPGDYYGAIRLDLSDKVGGLITEVAYYDYEDAGDWAYAYVAEDDNGAPAEPWLASTEEYEPTGAGWVELELDEPVQIEEPGQYWIVMHTDDYGSGYFPLGCTDPYVEDGGFINLEDPFDPGDWDTLDELGFDETWSIEAMVTEDPEPEGWSFYLEDTVPPEAEAGEDIEAYQGDTVTLDGSGSTDNVEVVNWTWTIEDPTGEETVKYGESVDYMLEYALYYDVELTVYDEAGHSDTDSIEIYAIDTENPVADAGTSDQTRVGENFTLDGSGSTDNVEVVNWTWTIQGVAGEAVGYEETVHGETVDHVFPYEGTYDIELEVSDAEGNSDTDDISMIVNPAMYELTTDVEGEGAIYPDHGYYEDGTEVELTAVPAEGWKFVEWTGDYEGTEEEITITMDSDKEITAVFEEEIELYELTVDVEGEGEVTIDPDQDEYEEGTEVTLTADPAEGWEFAMWTGDHGSVEEEITITMNSDKELTANFEVYDPAYFEVEITDYDDDVEEGDTVTVEYTVENTGELEGTQDIVFTVDGTEEDSVGITLGAGEDYSGEFEWEAEDEGDYDLEVASEDTSDSVTVTVEEEVMVPGFTLALLVLGAVIAVTIYYKKHQL